MRTLTVRLISKKREALVILGQPKDGLVITRLAKQDRKTFPGYKYRVTHIKSGYAMGYFETATEARAALTALLATGIDWTLGHQAIQTPENAAKVGEALNQPDMRVADKPHRGDRGVLSAG